NLSIKIGRKWGCGDPRADLLAAGGERVDVVAVQALQLLGYAPLEVVAREEFAEGISGGGEAARNTDAGGGERRGHFAQRGVLSADLRQVGEPQVLEPG